MAVILHVATTLRGGGAEAVLARLVLADDQNTHFVVGLAPASASDLIAFGVNAQSVSIRRAAIPVRGLLTLIRVIGQLNPDVVQTWMYHADFLGGIAAKLAGDVPIAWGIHNGNLDSSLIRPRTRMIARACAALSNVLPTVIITCSRTAASFHASRGYASQKMRVIPNGYDVGRFSPDADRRQSIRRNWDIADDTLLFGMVARWDKQKDHANLIAALARLKSDMTRKWRCALIGNGIDVSNHEIVSLLSNQGLSDHVLLCGARSDMPAVFSAIDVHVLSSAGEAFPNVVAEAMACGTPCVVTDVGDAAFIVADTGWIVPARDSGALARAMLIAASAFSEVDEWRKRQLAARARIVSEFSLDRMVRSYRDTWAAVAGTKGLRSPERPRLLGESIS